MNFVASLFDFSFSSFITTKLVRFIYAFSVVVYGLLAAATLFNSITAAEGFFGTIGGLLIGLIAAPLTFLFLTALTRIWMEMIIVLFRIAENTQKIAQAEDHGRSTAGPVF